MKLVFLLLAIFVRPSLVRAMEFEVQHPSEDTERIIIKASGEIKLGDDRKLHSVVAAQRADQRIIGITLTSPGGSIVESHRLATTIRSTGLITAVNGTCASACFLLFVAGNTKMVFPNSHIGVHSASEASIETLGSQAATTEMARIAQSLGTPDAIVGKIVVTTPDRMTWLTNADLRTIPGLRILTQEELASDRIQPSDTYQPGSVLTPGGGWVAAPASVATGKPPLQTAGATDHFDIDGALRAGHAPTEILNFLLANPGLIDFDIVAARNAGHSDNAILQYLETHDTSASAPSPPRIAPLTPAEAPILDVTQNPSYIAGRSARLAWENWFGGLSGDGRDGANWWAETRTTATRDRSPCENQFLTRSLSAAWLQGCQRARNLLLLADQRRRSDTFWKAGWNSL